MKKGPTTFWTEAENEFFKSIFVAGDYKNAATIMGVSVVSAQRRAAKLGLIKQHTKISQEETESIRILWENTVLTTKEISKKTNKTSGSLRRLAKKNGWKNRKLVTNQKFIFKPTEHREHESVDLPPEIGTATMLELNPRTQCAHITGGYGEDGSPKCCGRPIYRGSYCKEHYERFYINIAS